MTRMDTLPETAPATSPEERRRLIDERAGLLRAMQREDGHIVFELEADATIPSEYILLRHFLGEIDARARRASHATSAGSRARTARGRFSTTARATSRPR